MRKRLWAAVFGSMVAISVAACGPDGTPAGGPVSSAPRNGINSASPTAPPEFGAPLTAVAAWIKAGTPAAPDSFRPPAGYPKSPGDTDTFAYTSPSGKIDCYGGNSSIGCDVTMQNPPAAPAVGSHLPWQAGLFEASAGKISLGEYNGSPSSSRIYGKGAQLPYGTTVSAGNLACRMDRAGLFCLLPDAASAFRLNDNGVLTFGCLTPATDPNLPGAPRWSC